MNQAQPTIRYKFCRSQPRSDCGQITWQKGVWQYHDGELELCRAGFHCSGRHFRAFSYGPGEIFAGVEVAGNQLSDKEKQCWQSMRLTMTRPWSKNDSVQVVQELLREENTVAQLAAEHGIHPTQLHKWRSIAVEGLPELFRRSDSTVKLKALYAQLGRVTTQFAWLKRRSGIEPEPR